MCELNKQQPMEAAQVTSFANLYKYCGKDMELTQEQRRQKFLWEQKKRRHQSADKNRHLYDFVNQLTIEENQEENMECDELKSAIRKKDKYKLMQSEWFTDIPDDLEQNWLVKCCPQGFRVLLIAQNNKTIISTENRVVLNIKSNFPGGGGGGGPGITILDCIYNRFTKTIFVLDCLIWNSMSMLDSEANFRFFWLKTKFEEDPTLTRCKKYNFFLLESFPAHISLIQEKMFAQVNIGEYKYALDGTVFYHQESHYTFGYTPLVAWLASYMLPEKLHINVSPENLYRKPKDYICMDIYLENLQKRKKSKPNSEKQNRDSEMDVQ